MREPELESSFGFEAIARSALQLRLSTMGPVDDESGPVGPMRYYVSRQRGRGWRHEVHADGCQFMPVASNRIYLGQFDDWLRAARRAEGWFDEVEVCPVCCAPRTHDVG